MAQGPLAEYEEKLAAGELQPDPAQVVACQRLSAAASACDPSSSILIPCLGLSRAFVPETIDEITACTDQSCEELPACLLGAYCGFLFSSGELPAPPAP